MDLDSPGNPGYVSDSYDDIDAQRQKMAESRSARNDITTARNERISQEPVIGQSIIFDHQERNPYANDNASMDSLPLERARNMKNIKSLPKAGNSSNYSEDIIQREISSQVRSSQAYQMNQSQSVQQMSSNSRQNTALQKQQTRIPYTDEEFNRDVRINGGEFFTLN